MEKDPDLAGIFAFQRKRWAAPHRWPEIVSSIAAMRKHRFDLAIDLQGLARSGMFAWLAEARTDRRPGQSSRRLPRRRPRFL